MTYKDIYISYIYLCFNIYHIETIRQIHNNSIRTITSTIYTDFSINENFVNPKQHSGFQEIILKDLILRDTQPHNGNYIYHWNHNKQGTTVQLEKESGIAYMYGKTDTDYQLNSYKFTINDNGNIGGWNINYENNKFLGFCIVDNKNFKWNFYLQATLGKIEDMWYITGKIGEDDKAYAINYINNVKVNIYKIVLNSR